MGNDRRKGRTLVKGKDHDTCLTTVVFRNKDPDEDPRGLYSMVLIEDKVLNVH